MSPPSRTLHNPIDANDIERYAKVCTFASSRFGKILFGTNILFPLFNFFERPLTKFQTSFGFISVSLFPIPVHVVIELKSEFVPFECVRLTFRNSPAPSDLSDQLLVSTFL